ncbi:perlucin-like protein [Hyperolius riggenbachi]|uniref:perlucin-like protein n=1 Tax=Hyperolius riggenbachi TaxID=752182 RepID=UPI0035A3A41B
MTHRSDWESVTTGDMKNSYEQSLDDSNTDLEISSSHFNQSFFNRAASYRKYPRGWLAPAIVVLLIVTFVILAILTGILFSHYSTMVEELTVLKKNDLKKDVSDLWQSVGNIMGDLSKIKTKVDTTEGNCTSCPARWKLIRSHCYYFQSQQPKSWEGAREDCATRNGILVVMKNLFEMNALLPTIGRERYWLGLKRDSENTDRWIWADGSSLTFEAWNEGEPNNDKDNEHCAEIMGGLQLWNDRTCDHRISYICKGVWTC